MIRTFLIITFSLAVSSCSTTGQVVGDAVTRTYILGDYPNSILYSAGLPIVTNVVVPDDERSALDAYDLPFGEALIRSSGIRLTIPTDSPLSKNWLLYWSEEDSESPTDVVEELDDYVRHAIKLSLTAVEGADSFVRETAITALGVHFRGLEMLDQDCASEKEMRCFLGVTSSRRPVAVGVEQTAGVSHSPAPPFLGQDLNLLVKGGIVDTQVSRQVLAKRGIDTLSLWLMVSKGLPDTAFIYLAPGMYSVAGLDGQISTGLLPALLNAGVALPFSSVNSTSPPRRKKRRTP